MPCFFYLLLAPTIMAFDPRRSKSSKKRLSSSAKLIDCEDCHLPPFVRCAAVLNHVFLSHACSPTFVFITSSLALLTPPTIRLIFSHRGGSTRIPKQSYFPWRPNDG